MMTISKRTPIASAPVAFARSSPKMLISSFGIGFLVMEYLVSTTAQIGHNVPLFHRRNSSGSLARDPAGFVARQLPVAAR